MNETLRATYERALTIYRATVPAAPTLAQPFLVAVPADYERSTRRLMIVGQETFGWGERYAGGVASAADLMALHAEFDLGRYYRPSPFWQAAHQLHAALNPDGPARAFVWNNLVKVDAGRGRQPAEVEDAVSRLELLPAEIRLLAPDVVVFLTGPRYDARLLAAFPGATLDPAASAVARVQHSDLPTQSFRTYHPAYLRRAKRWAVLDEVAALARDA